MATTRKSTSRKSTKSAPTLDAIAFNALDAEGKIAFLQAGGQIAESADAAPTRATVDDKAIRAACGGYTDKKGKVVKRLADAAKAIRVATDDTHGLVIGQDANDGDMYRVLSYSVSKSGNVFAQTAILADGATLGKVAKALSKFAK